MDMKAADYISYVQERFKLERCMRFRLKEEVPRNDAPVIATSNNKVQFSYQKEGGGGGRSNPVDLFLVHIIISNCFGVPVVWYCLQSAFSVFWFKFII